MSTRTKINRHAARQLREVAMLVEDHVPDVIERFAKWLRRIADRLNPPKVITFPNARIYASTIEPGKFTLMAADGVPAGDEGDWVSIGGTREALFSFHDTFKAFGGGEVSR